MQGLWGISVPLWLWIKLPLYMDKHPCYGGKSLIKDEELHNLESLYLPFQWEFLCLPQSSLFQENSLAPKRLLQVLRNTYLNQALKNQSLVLLLTITGPCLCLPLLLGTGKLLINPHEQQLEFLMDLTLLCFLFLPLPFASFHGEPSHTRFLSFLYLGLRVFSSSLLILQNPKVDWLRNVLFWDCFRIELVQIVYRL